MKAKAQSSRPELPAGVPDQNSGPELRFLCLIVSVYLVNIGLSISDLLL